MESIGEAASRLLAKLTKQARKASGDSPEPIHNPGRVPLGSGENAGETSRNGSMAQSLPQLAGLGGAVLAANDNAGRVAASEDGVSVEMRRPASSADSNLDMFTGLQSFSENSTARWGK